MVFPTHVGEKETLIVTLAKIAIHEARLKESAPMIQHLLNKLKVIVELKKKRSQQKKQTRGFQVQMGSTEKYWCAR